jgi:hypothetical protein
MSGRGFFNPGGEPSVAEENASGLQGGGLWTGEQSVLRPVPAQQGIKYRHHEKRAKR